MHRRFGARARAEHMGHNAAMCFDSLPDFRWVVASARSAVAGGGGAPRARLWRRSQRHHLLRHAARLQPGGRRLDGTAAAIRDLGVFDGPAGG